ncbi:putative defense protein 3 [Ornithodoros turicata]|uniref:putative defense protein 3 n=1 Tax=Ornithodoros turicata TaxID=34597 RepID=UPI003138E6F9
MHWQSSLTLLTILLGACLAHPSGAPAGSCESEDPKHGVAPQGTQSPYAVQVEPTVSTQGNPVSVTVYGNSPYRGLLLTARDVYSSQIVHGAFTADGNTKTVDCAGGRANAITHNSNSDKTQSTVHWTAPAGYTGRVYFSATVVQDYGTYWKRVTSDAVTVQ